VKDNLVATVVVQGEVPAMPGKSRVGLRAIQPTPTRRIRGGSVNGKYKQKKVKFKMGLEKLIEKRKLNLFSLKQVEQP